MIKSVKLSGLSTNPTDYSADDGNLSSAINVYHANGAIISSLGTTDELIFDSENYFFVYLHSNANYENLICEDNSHKLYYVDFSNGTVSESNIHELSSDAFEEAETKKNITSVGSILVVHSNKGRSLYFIYRPKSNSYDYLGDKLPQIDISFGLETETGSFLHWEEGSGFKLRVAIGDTIVNTSDMKNLLAFNFNDDDKQKITDAVIGGLNRFVSEECHDNGLFAMPFLARYGYRMFDGSVTMLSAPVLMVPSEMAPLAAVDYMNFFDVDGDAVYNNTTAYFHIVGTRASLNYKILNPSVLQLLKSDWKDIVTDIDIFISSPFYQYDTNGKCTTIKHDGWDFHISEGSTSCYIDNISDGSYCAGKTLSDMYWLKTTAGSKWKHTFGHDRTFNKLNYNSFVTDSENGYQPNAVRWEIDLLKNESGQYVISNAGMAAHVEKEIFGRKHYIQSNLYVHEGKGKNAHKYAPMMAFDTPLKSESTFSREINECSLFYLAKSIGISEALEIGGTRTTINFERGYLNSINTKESVSNDNNSHDSITSDGVAVYNNRMNMFGIHRRLYEGFNPITCLQYLDAGGHISNKMSSYRYVVDIVTQYGNVSFESIDFSYPETLKPLYLYWPNSNCEKIHLKEVRDSGVYYWRTNMIHHAFLEGSIAKYGSIWDYLSSSSDYNSSLSDSIEQTFDYYDRGDIMTSEINNPFVYKSENSEKIGNGKIISLVPQAQALSQGQFGDYPMICFTTDGIWALSVNQTGGWAAKQPFSRDVVLNENPKNILQLDRQIMFATSRGLMLISGSNVDCISEIFNGGKDAFNVIAKHGTATKEGYQFLFDHILSKTSICDLTEVRDDITKDTLNFDFKSFIGNGTYLYDYTHQRLIIGNADYPFSFVFNMEDKLWTSIPQRICSSINSYPKCLAMTKAPDGDNLLVDFASTEGDSSEAFLPNDGFIMTRPLKLGNPDVMKTVTLVVVRGSLKRTSADLILFGSRDMMNWTLVGSCVGTRLSLKHGTPYKYFRVGIVTHLEEGESVDSVDIEFDSKQTNKIR